MREALNARPLEERTRREYQRVLDAYRLVYRGAPNSTKADPSVVAVAETLVQMGRRFEDNKILEEAVGQYRFLRREYPGSRYRFDALFTIGEIYQDDLGDPAAAAAAFQEFVRRYPRHHLARDARQAIIALNHPDAPSRKVEPDKTVAETQSTPAPGTDKDRSAHNDSDDEASDSLSSSSQANASADGNAVAKNVSATEGKDSAPNDDRNQSEQAANAPRTKLARVTGIRHWSTRDATRIAIDVDNSIEFSSQRIAHPSRIYFDLRDTRLSAELITKNVEVEDGFLKKMRVAQFSPRRARVVLEVEEGSKYDAFFIPNPPRLIIDIRGDVQGKPSPSYAARRATTNDFGSEAITQPVSAPGAEPSSSSPVGSEKSVAEVAETSDADTFSGSRATAGGLAAAKPLHDAVVKRVVEADEGDADDSPSDASSAPPAAKRTTRALNSAISKKSKADDQENTDKPEADNSVPDGSSKIGGSKKFNGSKNRTSTRMLASSKSHASPSADIATREALPMAGGDRSLIRALGLKIGKIVIDPGHGGHDTGTIGPNGLEEKDLVLEVGRRLGKMLETRLGAEVVYTRKDDTFIPLETRTAIANEARADLFVSIHANSSHDPEARGVETYYLNFTSSPDALEVAARENAVSETSIYELQDLIKKIALKEKIEESREFAWDVQQSLHSGLAARAPAIRDRGVKKAPFIVLIGANMPSILAEVSFVSNPTDERRLSTSEYRQRIAESLYRGIAKYVNGLSGVKVATKLDKATGGQ